MADKAYKLSPSDFGFLWDECPRCFYLKVARDAPRPPVPFPRIFNQIDEAMKASLQKIPSADWATGTPAGRFHQADGWVQSVPVTLPGRKSSCFIRGIFDTVLALDAGGYAVVDFKTSTISDRNAVKYGRQLNAYAFAMERPAPGDYVSATPVNALGLLVYEPKSFAPAPGNRAGLAGELAWLPVTKNDDTFVKFLDGVLAVLDLDEPPPPGGACPYCRYRETSRVKGW